MADLTIQLPKDFLKREVRSGFVVEEKTKELWAVELDLLQQFINVCRKYDLSWFALGGTLLGAVRHKGYIPWDDDIDIIMPRRDYDVLLDVGPKEFKAPYFFQCPLTEDKFWRTHVQIRNSSTTGCILQDSRKSINRGIFIDIMVLDEVPESLEERDRHRRRLKKNQWLRFVDRLRINRYPFRRFVGNVIAWFLGHRFYCYMFRKVNRMCAEYQGSGTSKVAHTTLSYREALVWDKSDFSSSFQTDFEFLKINIPVGYRHILAKQYGEDYMTIPDVHPATYHGAIIADTTVPYTEYFGQH